MNYFGDLSQWSISISYSIYSETLDYTALRIIYGENDA